MNKEILTAENAPKAIGPYSIGVKSGDLMFLSGQVGIVPEKGGLISDDTKEQAMQAMKNITAILNSSKATMENIIKTTIYLTAMSDFSIVNEVYASYFKGDFPARSTVAVKELPLGAKVEIEVTASVG
ncbi:MAG TPA: reactive intermediate/imine deaminase [Spirochaeta sp.]|nr:reactive intermediate/imine deaminase [Spirochaeta sp.]